MADEQKLIKGIKIGSETDIVYKIESLDDPTQNGNIRNLQEGQNNLSDAIDGVNRSIAELEDRINSLDSAVRGIIERLNEYDAQNNDDENNSNGGSTNSNNSH